MNSLFNLNELQVSGGINLLLDLSIKGTILLFIAGMATLIFRRAPASMRHFFWFLALGGLILLPVLSSILPSWQVPLIPKSTTAFAHAENQTLSIKTENRLSLSKDKHGNNLTEAVQKPILNEPAILKNTSTNQNARSVKNGFWNVSQNWTQWLLVLWFFGVFILVFRFFIGWFKISRIVQKAQLPENEHWEKTVDKLSSEIQIKRPVVLLKSDQINLPMTWGLFEPVILLPEDSDGWSLARCRIVLLHELAHIKRFDWLNLVISNFVCALYWFNPLVWIALRQMNKEREKACDDFVLRTGTKASDYADHLLKIIRSVQYWQWTSPVTVSMARRSQLEGRLLAILNPKLSRKLMSPLLAILTIITISSFVFPLAAMDLWKIPEIPAESVLQPSQKEIKVFVKAETVVANQPLITKEKREAKNDENSEQRQSNDSNKIESKKAENIPKTQMNKQTLLQNGPEQDSLAIQLLIDALKEEDWEIRRKAAWALNKIESPDAVNALIVAALDESLYVHKQEIWPSGYKDRGREERLNKILTGMPYWQIKSAFLTILDTPQLISKETENIFGSQNEKQTRLQNKADQDSLVVQSLIDALKDEDWEVRKQVAWALGEMEDRKAVKALSELLLSDESWEVRREAASALEQIEDRGAVDALSSALTKDLNWEVRREAAEALGQIQDHGAISALESALKDENRMVRREVVEALGELEDHRTIDALIGALKDVDWEIRRKAAWALGEIESPNAVEALITATKDENPYVRKQAVWALGNIEDRRAIHALNKSLKDEFWEVRKYAIDALQNLNDFRAVDPLIEILQNDSHREVRYKAAEALGDIEDRKAVDPLISVLTDPDWQIRKKAARALGEIQDRRAIQALTKALKDKNKEVRSRAAWALGEMKDY